MRALPLSLSPHTPRLLSKTDQQEPQLTGVLPVSKNLQKLIKEQQHNWADANKRAQALAKAENKTRDAEIKEVCARGHGTGMLGRERGETDAEARVGKQVWW